MVNCTDCKYLSTDWRNGYYICHKKYLEEKKDYYCRKSGQSSEVRSTPSNCVMSCGKFLQINPFEFECPLEGAIE